MNHATNMIARLLSGSSSYSEAIHIQAHLMYLGLHRDKAFDLLKEVGQHVHIRTTATTVIFPRCEELEKFAEEALYAYCEREYPAALDGTLGKKHIYSPLRRFMARKASEIVLGTFTPWS